MSQAIAPRLPQRVATGLGLLGGLLVLLLAGSVSLTTALERHRLGHTLRRVEVSRLRLLIDQYESTTYLALAGMAAADWELLLSARGAAKALTSQIERRLAIIPGGGMISDNDGAAKVPPASDPEVLAASAVVAEGWSVAARDQIRVLRGEVAGLKGNADLERFRRSMADLRTGLDALDLQARSAEERIVATTGAAVVAVGCAAVAITLLLGWLVRRHLLHPLVATIDLLREREKDLAQAHRQLVQGAHQAGMAEVATSVLHNVGNVLNGLTVAVGVMRDRVPAVQPKDLARLADLLTSQGDRLADFLVGDPRGRAVPRLLAALAEHAASDRDRAQRELSELATSVGHVQEVVALQQRYACATRHIEEVRLETLVDEALVISAAALERHLITIETDIPEMPPCRVEKHKVLQILVNLLSNAKYAMAGAAPNAPRRIRVEARLQDADIAIAISDTGQGIAPEHRARLFTYGFTTRPEGHGFGLHSCAVNAQSLGGRLAADSPGRGQGATFTLVFPRVQTVAPS